MLELEGEFKKVQANHSATADILTLTLRTCSKVDYFNQSLHCNHSGIPLCSALMFIM